ncbi:MAG: GNAT family N-acetyltransferase [Betaproteobacteria bacterium]|jgi:predicted GNAT family N-acyltransferase
MMISIVTGDWDSVRDHAQALRVEVFVVEQGVPIELEWDEADEVSTHAVAYDQAGQPVATGRLLPDGHIGRMAVRKSARGQGIGARVLSALLQEAQRLGYDTLCLHAQTHALGFYQRHGFETQGEEFMEAGIPHHRMTLIL